MHLSRRPERDRLTAPGPEGGLETASLRHQWRLLAPPGGLEELLQTRIRPLLVDLSARPDVGAVYFARYQQEALLFVNCDAELDLPGKRVPFVPELARYGGEEGFRIAEGIFEADSLPSLDLLEARLAGKGRPLRESSVLLTERLLDLLAFDRNRRIAFYRASYAWALDQGRWDEGDLRLLDARYRGLREGLAELLHSSDHEECATWTRRTRPWVERLRAAHGAGGIDQDLGSLAWSYAHMQCNRLGIDGDAEAILRYFMQRVHEDGLGILA
ncbi:MAG TPA: thiopeptide-type bacteriocin biosynthesis protein [Candidatus Polarisedimenticolaceae bacterium]|nr:thiopeptide-type bacteriocin biosynthesis protein [Candidatus Polarisedimenticolaceae bacterium]